jgi:hypothetical protein
MHIGDTPAFFRTRGSPEKEVRDFEKDIDAIDLHLRN